jgi:hypothetical protein
VAAALPHARQVVLTECGHVPQVELPERANGLIRDQVQARRPAQAAPARAGPRARSLLRRAVAQRGNGAPRRVAL